MDRSMQGVANRIHKHLFEAGQLPENAWAATLTGYEVFGYIVFIEDICQVPLFFCEPHHRKIQLGAVQLGAVLFAT